MFNKIVCPSLSKSKTVITSNLLFIGTWIDKTNLIAYSTLYGNYDWYCCRHLDCKRRLPAISHTNLQLLWRNEEKNFLCSYCSRHSFLSFNFLFIVGLLKMEFILIIDLDKDLLNVYYQYSYIPPIHPRYTLSIIEKIYKSQINIATLQQMQIWYILQLINILNALIMVQDDF